MAAQAPLPLRKPAALLRLCAVAAAAAAGCALFVYTRSGPPPPASLRLDNGVTVSAQAAPEAGEFSAKVLGAMVWRFHARLTAPSSRDDMAAALELRERGKPPLQVGSVQPGGEFVLALMPREGEDLTSFRLRCVAYGEGISSRNNLELPGLRGLRSSWFHKPQYDGEGGFTLIEYHEPIPEKMPPGRSWDDLRRVRLALVFDRIEDREGAPSRLFRATGTVHP